MLPIPVNKRIGTQCDSQGVRDRFAGGSEGLLGERRYARRLVAISKVLLANKGKTAEDILGWIDAMKVQSCMTLFDLISSLEAVLDAFCKG